jgi:hypothetical protein
MEELGLERRYTIEIEHGSSVLLARYFDQYLIARELRFKGLSAILQNKWPAPLDISQRQCTRNRTEFGPRSPEFEDVGVHCVTAVGDDTRAPCERYGDEHGQRQQEQQID